MKNMLTIPGGGRAQGRPPTDKTRRLAEDGYFGRHIYADAAF